MNCQNFIPDHKLRDSRVPSKVGQLTWRQRIHAVFVMLFQSNALEEHLLLTNTIAPQSTWNY